MRIFTTSEVTIKVEDLEKWIRQNVHLPEDVKLEKVVNVSLPKEIKFIFSKTPKIAKFEMTEEEREKFLDARFSEGDLSIRTINCFKAADINTPRDLSTYSTKDFKRFKNFGKKSLDEIWEFIEKYEISMKD